MSTERGSNANKIDNTFNRIMGDINKFEQVFKQGGSLEQAVMQVEGDTSHLKDVAQALLMVLQARFGTVFEEINMSPLTHVWQSKKP